MHVFASFISGHTLRCPVVLIAWATVATVSAQDYQLRDVLLDGQGWQRVSSGHQFTEGPVWVPRLGLLFTDVRASKIHRVAPDGTVTVWRDNTARANGLFLDPRGRVVACQGESNRIVALAVSSEGSTAGEAVLAELDSGSPNDLVVDRRGAVWFTAPRTGKVYHISEAGQLRVVESAAADPRIGPVFPNGVLLTPDQRTLLLADSRGPHVWTYQVDSDGTLRNRTPYYTLRLPNLDQLGPDSKKQAEFASHSGADGMTIDTLGRLYVATRVGLQAFDATGRMIGVISKPEPTQPLSNVCFGGADGDVLYVTVGDSVWMRRTKARGAFVAGPATHP